METRLDRLLLLFNTFGGSGLISKKMPGTVGSLVATVISYTLPHSVLLLFILSLLLFVTGTFTCQKYVLKHPENSDPGYIVIDEACAIFLGNAIILTHQPYKWYLYVLVFVFFRLFDMWKPYPINKIERYCSCRTEFMGLGIMLDDVLAIIPTMVCSWLIVQLIN